MPTISPKDLHQNNLLFSIKIISSYKKENINLQVCADRIKRLRVPTKNGWNKVFTEAEKQGVLK